VVPKPYQKPIPPIRVAASTPDTFPAIGRRGAPIFASVRHTSWAALAEQIRSYHDAWRAAGHPGCGKVFVSAPTYLAETAEAARAQPRDSILHFYQEQANLLEGVARLIDPETAARGMPRVRQLREVDYDEAISTNALIGTPEMIASRLRTLQMEIGLCGILAELNCGGLIPRDRVVNAMRLLCEAVKLCFAD
jgi:alkanesulfonate monooxygenase SsuD/methylene tetrahydromethanopterin reductase-like flavin-dependent oxidoreductase (luciferase family)